MGYTFDHHHTTLVAILLAADALAVFFPVVQRWCLASSGMS